MNSAWPSGIRRLSELRRPAHNFEPVPRHTRQAGILGFYRLLHSLHHRQTHWLSCLQLSAWGLQLTKRVSQRALSVSNAAYTLINSQYHTPAHPMHGGKIEKPSIVSLHPRIRRMRSIAVSDATANHLAMPLSLHPR